MPKIRVKGYTRKDGTKVKSHLRKTKKESKKTLNYYRWRRKSIENDIISGKLTRSEADKYLNNVNEFIDVEIDKLKDL